ncbi:hypothetical protein JTE90_018135 [Oedothorax gibbosus]|uniref:Major facilitator superfamily (MFS) profile domain-containing protein n=1 Tax=Oedothorax gibbosus TaxID=931172 RepID=A0AAV6V0V8_9ARAC|nr:hypothetical protein JTE90_018135 [Oedothorax gibbosus]
MAQTSIQNLQRYHPGHKTLTHMLRSPMWRKHNATMAEKGLSLSFGSRAMGVLRQVTVEPFLFFCLLGYSIRGVSFQSLLMDRACRVKYSDDVCDNIESYKDEHAQSTIDGNNLYTGVMLMNSLPALVVAIFLGPWADKYSRKYPILLAVSGMFLEGLASAILTLFPNVSPSLYVVVSLLSGITGGLMMTMSSCFSYMSDITEPRSRPSRFAILEFFFILAVLLGSFLGGQIYSLYGYLAVMIFAPISFAIAIAYAAIFLKDTKPKIEAEKRWEVIRDLVSLDNIKQSYRTCTRARPGNMRLQIWLLVWISCAQRLAEMGILAVGFPFVRIMYQWGVTAFSNANIVVTVCKALFTVVLVPIFSSKLMLHEAAIGLIGVLATLTEFTFMSVAYYEFIFYFACIGGALSSSAGIGVKSRISKLVHKNELGRAFSFLGMFEALTPLFGTVLFLQIYNASVKFFPGLAFAVTAVLILPSALIFMWMMSLPTVSQGEFGRDDEQTARPLEDIKPSKNYAKLEEEKY